MKRILLLSLLLLPIVALAQYPTFSNKQKLGVQTTGDGLIYRGNSNPNYNPSNINNAYFYLDTTTSKLYLYNDITWQQVYPTPQFDTTTLNVYLKISDTTAMLLPYFRDSDTTSLNLINRFALKLNISDTATMLTPYMKKADTISLSNRINLKFNISDTTILSNRITTNANNIITINNKLATKLDTIYVKFKDVVTMIENKDTINIGSSLTDGYAINIIGDSVNVDSIILDARYPDRDTTNELQDITFATTAGIVTISGGKVMNLDTLYNSVIDSVNLLIRDSIAAFTPLTEGYGINIIGDSINVDTSIIFTQSDTITLSNRIDLKLNISDTLDMLTPYFRDADTSLLNLTNRFNTKLNISDTTDMLAPYLREADTISLSNRINTKLDTIYVNYQTNVDVITNKDTINITPLTEGFGINIIADSINIDSAVILATQQKQIAYVKNQSGVTIYKGQAVYSSGSSGNNKLVTLASSATEQSSSKTFGVVETDSIPNGGHGYIITFGLLSGINTNLLTEGSSVYLSNTPGQLTTTKPQAPLHLVTIGVCIRQQQNTGSIFVKIQNGFEFDELHDVRITDLVDKSSIYYNLSEKLWRDTTAALLVSDTATMLNPYLRKLDTSILGYVTTYSNQYNINGNKTFNNTVSVDSLNATKQAKIQSLTVGKGGYAIIGGITGGISSTAFGFEALKNNTSGDWNTAIGYQTLLNNTTGWNNVAIGNNALRFNTIGEYNTAIGVDALDLNIVGNYNTAIGYNSGNGSKGSNNIFIGSNSGHLDSVNNVLVIGSAASPLLTGILSGNKKLGININPLNITSTFQVNSPISDAVKISSNTNSTNLELANNSGNSVFIKSTNRNMVLQTDTTVLMYLNGETNRVGILTMTPEQALEVNGTIRVDSLVNSLTPDKLVGANNANDLTDIKIGNGLSFSNDTLKVADNIINSGDTATLLRQDFIPLTSNQVIWTQGNKKLLSYFTQVYRNGQLLKSDSQYTITSDSIVTLEEGSYKLGDIITIIAIDNIIALAGGGGIITLQGDVTGSGTNTITTSIGVNKVTNTMLAGSISDNKLNTITATNKVSNSATTATVAYPYISSQHGNTIVLRNSDGDFGARNISATNFYGNATSSTSSNTLKSVTGGPNAFVNFSINTANLNGIRTVTIPDNNVSMATTNLSQTFGGTQTFSGTAAFTGNVTGLTSSAVSLGNVDNTSDLNKPISTATQTALNLKQNTLNGTGFVKASGTNISYDNSTYLTTANATSTYLPLTGGTISGTINRQERNHDGSASTFYYNILNYFAKRDNNKGNQTAQITFTDRPGTYTFQNNVRTSDIYLMTAKNFSGGQLGQYLDTTLSVVANQDGGRIGISKLNPAYKLDVNGTFRATDASLIGGTLGVTGATTLGSTLAVTGNITEGGNNVLTNLDTVSLSTRIDARLNKSDTATMLTPYFRDADTSLLNLTSRFQTKLNISDTASMLTNYLRSGVAASTYLTQANATSTYLPLTGGTLSGTLNGTNLNLSTGLDVNGNFTNNLNSNISALFRGFQIILAPNSDYQPTRIHFPNRPINLTFSNYGSGIRHKWDDSDAKNSFLSLYTSNISNLQIDAVSINSSGNVGIRDTTPSYTLDVNGTLGVTSVATFSNTSRFIGNVAINTTTAYKPLEVYSNANDFVSVGVRPLGPGQFSGIHFGYVEPNTDYRKSAIVFQRRDYTGGADASGSIHLLNVTQGQGARSADLRDAKITIFNNGFVGINDTTPSFNLDITGTLNATGATTLGSTLAVTGVTTLNNDLVLQTSGTRTTTAIRHYYGQQIRYAGEIQFQPSGGSGSQLAFYTNVSGNNTQVERMKITENGFIYLNNFTNITGSLNVTAAASIASTLTVYGVTQLNNLAGDGTRVVVTSNTGLLSAATTVNQTGLMTTGSTTGSTGSSTAFFDVTHNLGVNPQSVIITSQTVSGGNTKIFCEVIGKDASVFRVQAFNLDGSLATNKIVSIYWIAIK